MGTCLLGIDIGTTACKTVFSDLTGKVLAANSIEYPVIHPQPTWAEQDPRIWWQAVISNVKQGMKTTRLNPKDIEGVGVDSQREATIPLDARGHILSNAIIWMDQRNLQTAKKIKKIIPTEKVLQTSGLPIDYIYSAAKILWLKENRPGVYKKTRTILFPKDYIVFKLTGQRVTDLSMASRTMLLDIHKLRWSDTLCQDLDIPVTILPEIFESTQTVGELTKEAGHTLGLKPNIPIAAGGGDRPCEALGAGVILPGQINIGTGTATAITTPLSAPKIDPTGRFDCCCHVVPKRWEYEIPILTTGASLRWFRDNFGFEEIEKGRKNRKDPYSYFDHLVQKMPVGCEGLFYYPYLSGAKSPRYNSSAKGVFYGFTITHTKPHFVRAIYEGIAFQYAETIKLLTPFGIKVKEATIVGGESKSKVWNQIKSDVIGRPIKTLRVADAAALGSAILAGLASNIFNSVERALKQMIHDKDIYRPNRTLLKIYEVVLNKYEKIYDFIEKGYAINS